MEQTLRWLGGNCSSVFVLCINSKYSLLNVNEASVFVLFPLLHYNTFWFIGYTIPYLNIRYNHHMSHANTSAKEMLVKACFHG